MFMRTSCICFQYVTRLVTCSPVRPDLPKKSIVVFADLGSPDQDLRNLVAFDCRLFTKVCERSRAVKNQQSFVTTKCWYSQSLQVDGRCKASTCWRRRSSVAVISFRVVFSQPAALVGLPRYRKSPSSR